MIVNLQLSLTAVAPPGLDGPNARKFPDGAVKHVRSLIDEYKKSGGCYGCKVLPRET